MPELEHVIESAYQDMRGVMNGKKGYRLRHKELAGHLQALIHRQRLEAQREERNRLLDDLLAYRDELLESRGIRNPSWIGKKELGEWIDNRREAELKDAA